MELQVHQIDAFTDTIFRGNSAAVIILEQWLKDDVMQSIAMENNLSETAFILANKIPTDNNFFIRWFTPTNEVDFCGHATLAGAYVVLEKHTQLNKIVFNTNKVGPLSVEKNKQGQFSMSFPNRAPSPIVSPTALLEGLSIPPNEVWRNQQAYFAIYSNENAITQLEVNQEKIAELEKYDLVVTAPGEELDFVSRYFAPNNGIAEDPVTGSIHTGLAPFWAQKLGKNKLSAQQSHFRKGKMHCEVYDDKVILIGSAVKFLEGTIYL